MKTWRKLRTLIPELLDANGIPDGDVPFELLDRKFQTTNCGQPFKGQGRGRMLRKQQTGHVVPDRQGPPVRFLADRAVAG